MRPLIISVKADEDAIALAQPKVWNFASLIFLFSSSLKKSFKGVKKNMVYKTKVKLRKGRRSQKDKVGLAMADLYASSPYLSKKQKDKKITDFKW